MIKMMVLVYNKTMEDTFIQMFKHECGFSETLNITKKKILAYLLFFTVLETLL